MPLSMMLLATLGPRVLSLMPPDQVIQTQQHIYKTLKLCPTELDMQMTSKWALHNTFNDVMYEMAHNGFLPLVFTWTLSVILFAKIMMDKY